MRAVPSPTTAPARRSLPTGLVVRPFTGVRYDARRVGDLGAVTSPPYDVMDRSAVLAHETREEHNVVRLVRPRDDGCGPEGPYVHAAQLLRAWLGEGVLRSDGEVVYVYEQGRAGESGWQRGVVAAVGLGAPTRSAVVPHEAVMPGPVADRLALMGATGAHLEPVLLLHEGQDAAGLAVETVLEAVCAAAPDASLVDADGRPHRLWVLEDRPRIDVLARSLHRRGALIADGHHRWAAYHALAERHGAAWDGADGADGAGASGAWAAGLALLVDPARYPLHLGAIHRVVADLDAAGAVAALEPDVLTARALPVGAAAPDPGSVVLADGADGRAWALRPGPRLEDRLADLLPTASDAYRRVPATLLHDLLLPAWRVDDGRVSYHHDVPGALGAARERGGAAVLLPPTTLDAVVAVVADGGTMPRKSTSFGPKPLTGLVLRLVQTDGPGAP